VLVRVSLHLQQQIARSQQQEPPHPNSSRAAADMSGGRHSSYNSCRPSRGSLYVDHITTDARRCKSTTTRTFCCCSWGRRTGGCRAGVCDRARAVRPQHTGRSQHPCAASSTSHSHSAVKLSG
jgi:hypothetical protein